MTWLSAVCPHLPHLHPGTPRDPGLRVGRAGVQPMRAGETVTAAVIAVPGGLEFM